ncbi:sensor histidine kinase [Herbidospora mongoliensis]|uniref:sensor histidine kinase n=1 Tax=Herbidospora mongoliensis TaxID=688067 RepID=UPI000A018925|nr:histidine kinase [Herbidospora mongoliensis]
MTVASHEVETRPKWMRVPDRAARGLAVGIAGAAILLVVADLVISSRLPELEWPLPVTPEDVMGVAFPVFGALLVQRRPKLVIGWLLTLGGLGAAANIVSMDLALLLDRDTLTTPLAVLSHGVWNLTTYALGVLLPMLYPTGALLSRKWCWAGGFAAAVLAADWIVDIIGPKSLAIPAFAPYAPWSEGILRHLVTVSLVIAFSSLVIRFRRAEGDERRQILWPLLAIACLSVPWIIGNSVWWVTAITIPLIPAAITLAVLRYRLFGIDTLITRALVGAGMVTVFASVYVLAGTASSLFLAEVDRYFGLVAALGAGVFFHPMKRALHRLADRALYGTGGDPVTLADGLRRRLQRTDPVHGLLATLETIREGLAVTGAALDLDGTRTDWGELPVVARRVDLVWHGEPVGTLLIGPPDRRRFPAAHDERVIAALTPYIADAAHTMRLTTALRKSRERILTAREEERRRLRRDLHDGLGQTLTAMAMRITTARLNLKGSPEITDTLLADLRCGMDAVSGDIRELVYGLRPPALDDLGLAGAVKDLGPDALTVDGDLTGLPAAVEVAAYRIAQEALTNIHRHAAATHAAITITRGVDLVLEIRDNGQGMPLDAVPGVGLSSMRERAAELGGVCEIDTSGEGTTITARLPL